MLALSPTILADSFQDTQMDNLESDSGNLQERKFFRWKIEWPPNNDWIESALYQTLKVSMVSGNGHILDDKNLGSQSWGCQYLAVQPTCLGCSYL